MAYKTIEDGASSPAAAAEPATRRSPAILLALCLLGRAAGADETRSKRNAVERNARILPVSRCEPSESRTAATPRLERRRPR